MTIICRCEDVDEDEIVQAIRHGLRSLGEIKRVLRCGMGHCQGRTCRSLISRIIAAELKKQPSEIELSTFRPPVAPLPLGVIVRGKQDE